MRKYYLPPQLSATPQEGELAAESLKWGVLWVETGVFKA